MLQDYLKYCGEKVIIDEVQHLPDLLTYIHLSGSCQSSQFNHWTESVKAYYTLVQHRYNGGNSLIWLDKIGYAEEKTKSPSHKNLRVPGADLGE